jgi:hypothetical protein
MKVRMIAAATKYLAMSLSSLPAPTLFRGYVDFPADDAEQAFLSGIEKMKS